LFNNYSVKITISFTERRLRIIISSFDFQGRLWSKQIHIKVIDELNNLNKKGGNNQK